MAKGKIGIPRPRGDTQSISKSLAKIIETIEIGEGQRGDPLDAKVTWKDLRNANLIDFVGAVNVNAPLSSQVVPPDPLGDTPTQPQNLQATATYTAVVLSWTPAAYVGHKYTEIWRSETNNIADALLVGQAPYSVYADVVGNGKAFYYWVRFVGTGPDNFGPYSTSVFAKTALDVDKLLADLSGKITTSQLAQDLNTRLNLMDDPNNPNSITTLLTNETNKRITETQALASDISSLGAKYEENTAQLQVLAQTSATKDTVNAIYEVKTDVNGHVAGFGTVNNGKESQFFVNTDTFAILPQTGAFSVEEVNTGRVTLMVDSRGLPYRLRQWQPNTPFLPYGATQNIDGVVMCGDVIAPVALAAQRILYRCINGGRSGSNTPRWGGLIVRDGTVTWEKITEFVGPVTPFAVSNNQVVINNAFIKNLNADNIAANSIGADQLDVVNLSAVSSNMGEITAGVLKSGDNRFVIDLNRGRLTVYDANSRERVVIGNL